METNYATSGYLQQVDPTRLEIKNKIEDYKTTIATLQGKIADLEKVLPLFPEPCGYMGTTTVTYGAGGYNPLVSSSHLESQPSGLQQGSNAGIQHFSIT